MPTQKRFSVVLAFLLTLSLIADASVPSSNRLEPIIDLALPGATMPLDYDSYPEAPAGLSLEQVHVYVRHGERTPVTARMSNPPASIPESWLMCKTARRFRAAVHASPPVGAAPTEAELSGIASSSPDGDSLRMRKVVERADGTSSEDECLFGELTDIGRQSTYNYGVALRKLYVDRLGFLPNIIQNSDETYFRSTNMPRTIESLQHIIHGLYPASKRDNEGVAQILIRNGKDENLIGNSYACKRLEILLAGFADAAASAYNPILEGLNSKVSKYIDGAPLRVDGHPRASGILDTVRAAVANGVKVPAEFHEKTIIDTLEKAVVREWFDDRTEEVRRLGMGRLLADMSRRMQTKAAKGTQDPLKILVHSTHDTGLAGLCATFDIFDDKWPAFTASLTFELFKKTQALSDNTSPKPQSVLGSIMKHNASSTNHYVRVRYQNRTMPLPVCAEEGKHLEGAPEFCTLEAFRERVEELTPVDWNAECSPRGKAE